MALDRASQRYRLLLIIATSFSNRQNETVGVERKEKGTERTLQETKEGSLLLITEILCLGTSVKDSLLGYLGVKVALGQELELGVTALLQQQQPLL